MKPLVGAGAGEAEEAPGLPEDSKRFYIWAWLIAWLSVCATYAWRIPWRIAWLSVCATYAWRSAWRSVLIANCTLILLVLYFELVLAFLIRRGAIRPPFSPLMQWLQIYGNKRFLFGFNGKVKSKNLVTKCLIGKGSSGIFYETTWLNCSQGSPSRLTRKDFPGVKGEIFESEVIPLFELPDHPNLLKTLCWTVDTRSCSLVTEYMRDDLSSVVRRKKEELRKKQAKQPGIMGPTSNAPFELHEALEIAIQIAIGMEYLHLLGITHGDLKANNIFIDWKEDKVFVKLADFGLLQTKRRSTMVSQRAFCFRMMEWSAPELLEDYLRSTSENLNYLWTKSPIGLETSTSTIEKYTEVSMMQADSYSFALICAFVLSGQLWNAKLSPSELQREISNSSLRPTLPSECSKTLRSLIYLCWDGNPQNRPTFSYIREKLQEEQRNLHKGESTGWSPWVDKSFGAYNRYTPEKGSPWVDDNSDGQNIHSNRKAPPWYIFSKEKKRKIKSRRDQLGAGDGRRSQVTHKQAETN